MRAADKSGRVEVLTAGADLRDLVPGETLLPGLELPRPPKVRDLDLVPEVPAAKSKSRKQTSA